MAYTPDILIFSGKYGEEYFDASTPEKRAGAFLHVLRARAEQGWYYEPTEPGVDAEQYAFSIMTDEQINALPETIAADMRAKREKAARRISSADTEHRNEKRWWDMLQELLALPTAEAIQRENGRGVSIAERLSQAHQDYEYEGYDFETFTKVATS